MGEMITETQWRELRNGATVNKGDLLETIEALCAVARAAEFAVFNNAPFLGQADLQISIDALPDWLTDG